MATSPAAFSRTRSLRRANNRAKSIRPSESLFSRYSSSALPASESTGLSCKSIREEDASSSGSMKSLGSSFISKNSRDALCLFLSFREGMFSKVESTVSQVLCEMARVDTTLKNAIKKRAVRPPHSSTTSSRSACASSCSCFSANTLLDMIDDKPRGEMWDQEFSSMSSYGGDIDPRKACNTSSGSGSDMDDLGGSSSRLSCGKHQFEFDIANCSGNSPKQWIGKEDNKEEDTNVCFGDQKADEGGPLNGGEAGSVGQRKPIGNHMLERNQNPPQGSWTCNCPLLSTDACLHVCVCPAHLPDDPIERNIVFRYSNHNLRHPHHPHATEHSPSPKNVNCHNPTCSRVYQHSTTEESMDYNRPSYNARDPNHNQHNPSTEITNCKCSGVNCHRVCTSSYCCSFGSINDTETRENSSNEELDDSMSCSDGNFIRECISMPPAIQSLAGDSSIAVAILSWNPYEDFQESMYEMMLDMDLEESVDLDELLFYYLSLNPLEVHDMIREVFSHVWSDIVIKTR